MTKVQKQRLAKMFTPGTDLSRLGTCLSLQQVIAGHIPQPTRAPSKRYLKLTRAIAMVCNLPVIAAESALIMWSATLPEVTRGNSVNTATP